MKRMNLYLVRQNGDEHNRPWAAYYCEPYRAFGLSRLYDRADKSIYQYVHKPFARAYLMDIATEGKRELEPTGAIDFDHFVPLHVWQDYDRQYSAATYHLTGF